MLFDVPNCVRQIKTPRNSTRAINSINSRQKKLYLYLSKKPNSTIYAKTTKCSDFWLCSHNVNKNSWSVAVTISITVMFLIRGFLSIIRIFNGHTGKPRHKIIVCKGYADSKVTVWFGLCAGGFIGPYLIKDAVNCNVTVNGKRYVRWYWQSTSPDSIDALEDNIATAFARHRLKSRNEYANIGLWCCME